MCIKLCGWHLIGAQHMLVVSWPGMVVISQDVGSITKFMFYAYFLSYLS